MAKDWDKLMEKAIAKFGEYRDMEEYKLDGIEKPYKRATPIASWIFEERMKELGLKKILINLPNGKTGVIWR